MPGRNDHDKKLNRIKTSRVRASEPEKRGTIDGVALFGKSPRQPTIHETKRSGDGAFIRAVWGVFVDRSGQRNPARSATGTDDVCESGTGVPPVNHAQDARATIKLHQYPATGRLAPPRKRLLRFGFVIDTTGEPNARLIRLLIGCSGRPSS